MTGEELGAVADISAIVRDQGGRFTIEFDYSNRRWIVSYYMPTRYVLNGFAEETEGLVTALVRLWKEIESR